MLLTQGFMTRIVSSHRSTFKTKKSFLNDNEESLMCRYPVTGPLNITNYGRYLQLSRDFFNKNYGKPGYEKAKLEDFSLLYEIGRGSFGNVVLATHTQSNIDYSIKIISKAKLIRLKSVEQTIQERNIMLGLNNPFTIYLIYSFTDNSYIYFVLPYIDRGELFFQLREVGRFSEQQAKFYAAQVVLGLEYLHNLDLVYRDLKPENILLDQTGYLRLIDFGFSKVLKNSRTYTLCGTPEYMAPEIILNKGHGAAADWWAAGVLIYELVVGYTPFRHRNRMRVYEKIVTNSYRMSHKFSGPLQDLIKHLLQTDTTKRFGNLKGGVNDIKNHKWFTTTNWMAVLNRKITPEALPVLSEEVTKRKPLMEFEHDSEDRYGDIFNAFQDKT